MIVAEPEAEIGPLALVGAKPIRRRAAQGGTSAREAGCEGVVAEGDAITVALDCAIDLAAEHAILLLIEYKEFIGVAASPSTADLAAYIKTGPVRAAIRTRSRRGDGAPILRAEALCNRHIECAALARIVGIERKWVVLTHKVCFVVEAGIVACLVRFQVVALPIMILVKPVVASNSVHLLFRPGLDNVVYAARDGQAMRQP